jgi:Mg2+/Co2+ transporter CorB
VLDLGELDVSEVMTHRNDVYALNADLPKETLFERVLESPFTRIPLWRDSADNIVGILNVKAALKAVQPSGGEAPELPALAATPWFIPDSTTLLDQLKAFRERREHFAVVVDEYGAYEGIVTLEDIVEEIVGDIFDEHETPVAGARQQADGSLVLRGTVAVRDLNREYGWSLPEDGAATIAGLVVREARVIPEAGQVFEFHGFRFEILRRQRNRVTSLRLRPLPS